MDNIVPEYEFDPMQATYILVVFFSSGIFSRQIILMLLSMKDTEFETIFCDYFNEQIEKYYQEKN